MAARENQGLQIALIIFVVITIALSVSTFMFFSKYDEERNKIAEKVKAAETATSRAVEAEDQVKELKRLLGATAADPIKTIQENHKKDFQAMGPGLADDQQNYRRLAQQLTKALVAAEGNVKDAEERIKKLNDKIVVDETSKVAEFKKYTSEVDVAKTDVTDERGKFDKDRTTVTASKDTLQKQVDAKRKEFDEALTKLKGEIEDRDRQIVKLTQTIDKMNEENVREEKDLELADGSISWVSQGEQIVWVNKGSDDGLRQQITFKVIARDEPDPATAKAKATVEVTRVTDKHSSEARIVSDDPKDPIMPGDLVFSTAWQPGRIEHFALAGFMDVNRDGESDRELIKRLVTMNGGVIDAELTDDGKLIGEMQVSTKYVIMGDRPTEKNMTAEIQKSLPRFIDNARKLGIKQMSVPKFLDYVGYKSEQRTVALDKNAKPSDFRKKVPEIPRKSIGKTIDYTPIRPKAKNTQY